MEADGPRPPFDIWARETYGDDMDWIRRNYSRLRQVYDSGVYVKPNPHQAPPPKPYDRYDDLS